MAAYSEMYLNEAMANLGEAVEYAVKGCGMDMDVFFGLFLSSGIAAQFEKGNPKYVSGMSGTELVLEIMNKANYRVNVTEAAKEYEATPEYWCGWILAYLQWETAWSFRWICSSCSAEEILALYPILHEASEQKASSVLRNRIENARKQTQLQRMRLYAGMTQAALAQKAEVSLRSVQMYEQRRKDINKARAEYLIMLSSVLNCDPSLLLQRD